MWKFNINKEKFNNSISIEQIFNWVDIYNGTFLFTSENTFFKSNVNIVGLNPVITIYPNYSFFGEKNVSLGNFEVIDKIIEQNNSNDFMPLLLGYFGFDFKMQVEESGLFKNLQDKNFPLSYFAVFEHYLIFNSNSKEIEHIQLSFPFEIKSIRIDLKEEVNINEVEKSSFYTRTNMPKDVFCMNVEKIKNYIKEGDIYQVNLTRKIEAKTEYSFQEIAKKLYYSNNIEFGVIAKVDKKFIISTSPERFFKIQNNNVLTSPIKGTIQKTKSKKQNEKLVKQLLNDSKELAELAMIVDLLRNDIGRICEYNSVEVKGYPIIKELENVYHLVANIEGKLERKSIKDILKGVFPGGSISGCPKIRACQIIEELEKFGRGPYTGSFGYISTDGRMDFNILIRTLFYDNHKIWFNVGGGITLKSDPVKEYEETIHKASSIWEAINIEYIEEERYCI
jgi:para-aminobenzoate synthetase component I